MTEIKIWKDYGEWYPTAQMRWGQRGNLEQVWRRNFEEHHPGGTVMGGNGFEEEWRDVPNQPPKGTR